MWVIIIILVVTYLFLGGVIAGSSYNDDSEWYVIFATLFWPLFIVVWLGIRLGDAFAKKAVRWLRFGKRQDLS